MSEVTKKKAKPKPCNVNEPTMTGKLGTINKKYLIGHAKIPITIVSRTPNF